MQKLLSGYQKFQAEVFPRYAGLFKSLENGQTPSTLFLTCSDSRIVPHLILQSDPGDLFVSRNAGNIVPAYGEGDSGVTAAIEYAVLALKVKNIIVCGHSNCGAMKAVLGGKPLDTMPSVDKWLRHSADAMQAVPFANGDDQDQTLAKERLLTLTRANVLLQLQHLQTHPSVTQALSHGQLQLFGWVYEIPTGIVESYDAATGRFAPLTAGSIPVSVTSPLGEPVAS